MFKYKATIQKSYIRKKTLVLPKNKIKEHKLIHLDYGIYHYGIKKNILIIYMYTYILETLSL